MTESNNAIAFDQGTLLKCPNCGSTELHHHTVDVWTCATEDSERMAVVNVRAATLTTDCFAGKAPAVNVLDLPRALMTGSNDRRGAVEVRFWCEQCSAVSVLRLTQHKGATVATMVAAG